MLEEFPCVLTLISLNKMPLACLLWKYKRNHHFRVNDSSPSFLFWHLLMAADISATAQQGENGNPDLPTQVNSFSSACKAVLCSLSLKPITCMSLPILSLPSSIWLSLGYYSCYLSGQAFLSIRAPRIHSHYPHHNTSTPLQFAQCKCPLLHFIDQSSSCTESSPHTFPSYSPLS